MIKSEIVRLVRLGIEEVEERLATTVMQVDSLVGALQQMSTTYKLTLNSH